MQQLSSLLEETAECKESWVRTHAWGFSGWLAACPAGTAPGSRPSPGAPPGWPAACCTKRRVWVGFALKYVSATHFLRFHGQCNAKQKRMQARAALCHRYLCHV